MHDSPPGGRVEDIVGLARLTPLLVVLLAALVVTGCEVSARVNIDVRDDGSGTVGVVVELDADAVRTVEAMGGPVEEGVRLDDLEAAGWSPRWERQDAGATLRLEKEFARAEDLTGVIEELSGAHGPLQTVALDRNESLFHADLELRGRADLTQVRTGISDDSELVAALAGDEVDIVALEAQLTERLQDAFRLEVSVSLPGSDPRLVEVEPGTSVDLATSGTAWNLPRIVLVAAAAVLAGAALVVVFAGGQDRRRGTRA